MNIYDTYGFRTNDLAQGRAWIEELLEISLNPHHSSYIGNYYRTPMSDKYIYELQENYYEEEGWAEEDHQDLGLILRISHSPKPDEIRALLLTKLQEHIVFIRREVITDDRWSRTYQYIDGKDELVKEQKLPDIRK
jgi:hypothetical protein